MKELHREHRHHVLLADDNAAVRRVLSWTLSSESGCAVTTAESGDEALALLRGGLSPCVLVLDLLMLRGQEATFRATLRAEPRLTGLPVVLLTCHEKVPAIARTLEARAWLVKPPELNELLAVIARECGFGPSPVSGRPPTFHDLATE